MKEYKQRGGTYIKDDEMPTSKLFKDICYGDNGFDTKKLSMEEFDKNPYGGAKMFIPNGKKDKS